MRKIVIVFVFVCVALFSCDRRGSARENLQNSISEFSKKYTFKDVVTFHPKTYTEIQTDSIISNTFKVSIKNYSKMDSQILQSFETINDENNIRYHRVFESEIRITTVSKEIFNTTLNAKDFVDNSEQEFWNYATLAHVWVNQEQSTTHEVNLGVSIINPRNDAYKLYELVVDVNGKHDLFLIEEQG